VRFIYVAPTDNEALTVARRAYKVWQTSFMHLWRAYGQLPNRGERVDTFDALRDIERKGVAGSPATVRDYLKAHLDDCGANYLVGQMVFGDMHLDEALSSIDLFAREVMPHLEC
jgi:alkanesulfonate monooxygenase SsuD/methylene tetrahydromethanopterin reductase-like flavin-dependent oxidoreductase (luciferase family)